MKSPRIVETPMVKLNDGGAASKAEYAASFKTYRSAASKNVSPNTSAKASQTNRGSHSSETFDGCNDSGREQSDGCSIWQSCRDTLKTDDDVGFC